MPALRSEEVRTQVHRAVNTKISTGWSSLHEDAAALKNFRVSFVALEDLGTGECRTKAAHQEPARRIRSSSKSGHIARRRSTRPRSLGTCSRRKSTKLSR